jgi:hypothetical protein
MNGISVNACSRSGNRTRVLLLHAHDLSKRYPQKLPHDIRKYLTCEYLHQVTWPCDDKLQVCSTVGTERDSDADVFQEG